MQIVLVQKQQLKNLVAKNLAQQAQLLPRRQLLQKAQNQAAKNNIFL